MRYRILFVVASTSGIGPTHIQWCATQAETTLHGLNPGELVIITENDECDDLENKNSADGDSGYCCPIGHIYKNGFCRGYLSLDL